MRHSGCTCAAIRVADGDPSCCSKTPLQLLQTQLKTEQSLRQSDAEYDLIVPCQETSKKLSSVGRRDSFQYISIEHRMKYFVGLKVIQTK